MDILEELDTLRLGPSEYKIVQKAYTEIERLREYERLVKFIASDYIELSHEKAQWQRDDWYKRCRAIQQKGTE